MDTCLDYLDEIVHTSIHTRASVGTNASPLHLTLPYLSDFKQIIVVHRS